MKEINSNVFGDKNGPLIINNIGHGEKFDKIDHLLNNKKKILKPVEHPILLNNKNNNDKNKETTYGKIILKSQNKNINNNENKDFDNEQNTTREKIQISKIIKKTDSNFNKSNSDFSISIENKNTNNNNEILLKSDNNLKTIQSGPNLNNLDVNYIKNIDLNENNKQNINESFNSFENENNKNNSINNPLMNISDHNFNPMNNTNKSSKWNFNKNLLDDSEFRKTHIIKEKLDIEYIPEKPINNINLSKINSINSNNQKHDNQIKIKTPRIKENDIKLSAHKKVNSMIFIENTENETLRDLARQINCNLDNESQKLFESNNQPNGDEKEVKNF